MATDERGNGKNPITRLFSRVLLNPATKVSTSPMSPKTFGYEENVRPYTLMDAEHSPHEVACVRYNTRFPCTYHQSN